MGLEEALGFSGILLPDGRKHWSPWNRRIQTLTTTTAASAMATWFQDSSEAILSANIEMFLCVCVHVYVCAHCLCLCMFIICTYTHDYVHPQVEI